MTAYKALNSRERTSGDSLWRATIGILIPLTLGIFGMLHVPHAQPPGKVYRIGSDSTGFSGKIPTH